MVDNKIIDQIEKFAYDNRESFIELFRDHLIRKDLLDDATAVILPNLGHQLFGRCLQSGKYKSFIIGKAIIKIARMDGYINPPILDFNTREGIFNDVPFNEQLKMVLQCEMPVDVNGAQSLYFFRDTYIRNVTELVSFVLHMQLDDILYSVSSLYINSSIRSIATDLTSIIIINLEKELRGG